MSQKAIKSIGWVITILLALFFGLTSILKIIENEKIVAQTAAIGIDVGMIRILGLIEFFSIILFIVPRTGVVGTLLLIAYMGGVMATALQHQQPMAMFTVIQVLIWIAAVLRFPELGQRLFQRT
ncbi:DoxX family protein [Chitinophaga sp. CF418]|uniref:DoxX family protein n=1 Tax=Chitinophaga sp. CF418 TaxID=1855287 RepID=UPI000920AF8C|nr:DoxX family protein [Chitinophaga sp. CF418]SHN23727.1 DoxX-like family protein [Chitinophaga sp. CF418]